MLTLILVLVVLALLGVLGAVIEGLLWLTLIAAVAFVVAAFVGWSKLKSVVAG